MPNNEDGVDHSQCALVCTNSCYWFEAGGFHNWTIQNNTLQGCGAAYDGMGDVFVAACAPNWNNDLTPMSSGNPVTVGQPFKDIAVLSNRFLQSDPRTAVAIWGSAGLTIVNNSVELHNQDWAPQPPAPNSLEGSFDGFALQPDGELEVHGWVVDTMLPATTSSNVTIQVDGQDVLTATANSLRPDLVPVVTSDPHHGFDLRLPNSTQWKTNHTIEVFALRSGGVRIALKGGPMCVNLFRESCAFPRDCKCGAPLPPTLSVSNSVQCDIRNNDCYGKSCTVAAGGCS